MISGRPGGRDFRKEKSHHVPDLRVQLDVFDDQRDTDEELSNQGPPGIDLSSHVDVFYAILGQVSRFVVLSLFFSVVVCV